MADDPLAMQVAQLGVGRQRARAPRAQLGARPCAQAVDPGAVEVVLLGAGQRQRGAVGGEQRLGGRRAVQAYAAVDARPQPGDVAAGGIVTVAPPVGSIASIHG